MKTMEYKEGTVIESVAALVKAYGYEGVLTYLDLIAEDRDEPKAFREALKAALYAAPEGWGE